MPAPHRGHDRVHHGGVELLAARVVSGVHMKRPGPGGDAGHSVLNQLLKRDRHRRVIGLRQRTVQRQTPLARGNQGIAVTRRQANRQHQSAARACHYQRLAAKDQPKVTIYGHTAGVLGFSDEFKAQDTREARARLLYARGWAASRKADARA